MTTSAVSSPVVPAELLQRHRETLDGALAAIKSREWFGAYSESPKGYGDEAPAIGKQAFDGQLGSRFVIDQPTTGDWVGSERSPYGFDLGVTYPKADVDALIAAALEALPQWRDVGADARVGILLDALHRINARSHEIAHAVMHTTGQAFPMAFQAGGPHAQERALEALAYAYHAMSMIPAEAVWEKPQGRRPPIRMRKTFTVAPRGIGLVVGCSTFPTWNSYPGLFASLATGNPVIVKPGPSAVLPLAITVAILRETLVEAGLPANLVTLAVDGPDERLAGTLAKRPEVRVIDYTGSTTFGEQLEREASHAVVFTEKAGVNAVVIDSTDSYEAMLQNLAFTLSLYSGQMCTTTQNIYIPRAGIETDAGHKTFDELGADLASAVQSFLSDPVRAAGVLGAIVNDDVLARVDGAADLGRTILDSVAVTHPDYADAALRTPVIVAVDGPEVPAASTEHFGPITLLVPTDDSMAAIDAMRHSALSRGAMTAGVYSTGEHVIEAARAAALDGAVALSENLYGAVFVNQSAAYSDFHGTGLNPAANASLTDLAYVTPRFHVVQSRHHIPEEGA
jgi:phenylacetic acid degradation protein paaN